MIVLVMVGLPLAGKTTLARNIMKDGKWELLSYDDLRHSYCHAQGVPYSESFTTLHNKRIVYSYHQRREELIKRKSNIILDSTNIDTGTRSRVPTLFPDYTRWAVFVDTPLLECLQRNATRTVDRQVPTDIIENFAQRLEAPTEQEGFQQVVCM